MLRMPSTVRVLLATTAALLGSATAQSASTTVGVSLGLSPMFTPPRAAPSVGVHVSSTLPGRGTLQWRPSLELSAVDGARYGMDGVRAQLRADVVALRPLDAGRYAGVGVGSGVLLSGESNASGFPAALFSPLDLLNVVGVYGQDFGTYRAEGVVRLGLQWGVGVHVDLPLR